MRWLYKLENKLGKYYIRNLMTVIVAGMVIVYLGDMFMAAGGMSVSSWLSLNIAAVMRGQVWRLITFVFIPPSSNVFFILINLYFYFMLGRMLESYWGGFRLNVYYLFGILGTIAGAFVAYFLVPYVSSAAALISPTNAYLNLSLFLALATLMPDMEFRLFFLIPLKAKWLAIAYAVLLVIPILQTVVFSPNPLGNGLTQLIALVFSLINYLIFFGPTLISGIRQQIIVSRNRRQWRNRNR